jgi:DNA gyrase/topoisomerase IV subunit A
LAAGATATFPLTITMDPDYRAMLLAVLARTAQLIVEVEAIIRESTNSETVDNALVQLAELRRLMADIEAKLRHLDDG